LRAGDVVKHEQLGEIEVRDGRSVTKERPISNFLVFAKGLD
jgi:hypothetical protein